MSTITDIVIKPDKRGAIGPGKMASMRAAAQTMAEVFRTVGTSARDAERAFAGMARITDVESEYREMEKPMASTRGLPGGVSTAIVFKPICARCGKLVDKIDQREDYESGDVKYRFECHGDIEMLNIPRQRFQDRDVEGFFRAFKAFAGPTREERRIQELEERLAKVEFDGNMSKEFDGKEVKAINKPATSRAIKI